MKLDDAQRNKKPPLPPIKSGGTHAVAKVIACEVVFNRVVMNLFLRSIDVYGWCWLKFDVHGFCPDQVGLKFEKQAGKGNWDTGPGFGLLKPLIPEVWDPRGPSPFCAFRLSGVGSHSFFCFTTIVWDPCGPELFEKYILCQPSTRPHKPVFFIPYFVQNHFLKKVFRPSQAVIVVHFSFSIALFRPVTFVSAH